MLITGDQMEELDKQLPEGLVFQIGYAGLLESRQNYVLVIGDLLDFAQQQLGRVLVRQLQELYGNNQ